MRPIPDYERANRLAANLILLDVGNNGEDGLMVRWARLWIERHGAEPAQDHRQPVRGQTSFDWEQTAA